LILLITHFVFVGFLDRTTNGKKRRKEERKKERNIIFLYNIFFFGFGSLMRGKGLAMHALDQKIRAQEERGKRNEERRTLGVYIIL